MKMTKCVIQVNVTETEFQEADEKNQNEQLKWSFHFLVLVR